MEKDHALPASSWRAVNGSKREDNKFSYDIDEELRGRFTGPPIPIVIYADTRSLKAHPKVGYREQILNVSRGSDSKHDVGGKCTWARLSWGQG